MNYCVISIEPFDQNCLLIWCALTNAGLIIDPGGNFEKICSKIDQLKINMKKILLTHGHFDHVGAALKLKKYYNIPIIGPNIEDKFLLNNLSLQCLMLGMDICANDIVIPDMWLQENDIINIGHENFIVLHCPGHSPGHVVFWNKKNKFISMGDVLFRRGIGRTDLPGGDINILMQSIKNKLFVLENDVVFVPGHGPGSTIGYERVNNYFLK